MANALPIPIYQQWKELQKRKSDALDTGDEELLTLVDAQILDFAKRNSINLELPVTEEVVTPPVPVPPVPTGEPPKPEEGTFTVKEGGWGASTDPSTWTVTNMKDPPTKFKVVDTNGKNVATEFTTHDNAQNYIDYAKWSAANGANPPGPEPTPTPTPTPGKGDVDKFGIRKIFPDASSGVFETNFKLEEKMRNYSSNKPSEWSTEYTNVSKDIIQNQEVTIYEKINGFKKEADTISLKLGGPDHHDGARFWVIPDFSTSGDPKRTLEIEDPHPENHSINPKPLTKFDSIVGKWFGYKGISYQISDKVRHVESWIHFPVSDIDNVAKEQDKWQKYMEYDTDKEKKNYSKFLGKNTTSRLDGVKKGDPPTFKFASLREIQPPK